jgi:uncharacterized membrane protein
MTEVTASIPTLRSSNRPAPGKTNAARQWLPPVGLIVLSLIPVLAGAMRLNELMGSPQVTANNARFVASPIPITVHVVSVTVYSLLGALQFVPSLRRRTSSWHRIAGRILVPAGVLVALSGLWMSAFYPRPPGDGESLVVVRLMFGSAMFASIVLALLAIRRRDFASHGAWMTRGYAIALGAGTQGFTMMPWVVVFGPIGAADELPRTLLMTAGWVINLGVAEYVIRNPERRSRKPSACRYGDHANDRPVRHAEPEHVSQQHHARNPKRLQDQHAGGGAGVHEDSQRQAVGVVVHPHHQQPVWRQPCEQLRRQQEPEREHAGWDCPTST